MGFLKNLLAMIPGNPLDAVAFRAILNNDATEGLFNRLGVPKNEKERFAEGLFGQREFPPQLVAASFLRREEIVAKPKQGAPIDQEQAEKVLELLQSGELFRDIAFTITTLFAFFELTIGLLGQLVGFLLSLSLVSCASTNGTSKSDDSKPLGKGPGPALVIADEIPFSADAMVRYAVLEECMLPRKLSHFIKEFSQDHSSRFYSNPSQAPKDAQILTVEIVDTMGGGGGAWSGAKAVSIRGSLTQNGEIIVSFMTRRYSGGGAFSIFKGTCVRSWAVA